MSDTWIYRGENRASTPEEIVEFEERRDKAHARAMYRAKLWTAAQYMVEVEIVERYACNARERIIRELVK
jgi:hypothetical protein